MKESVLPKSVVEKWINEVMQYQYDITIHANEYPLQESFVRSISHPACNIHQIDDNKTVITSNDPVVLASIALTAKRKGFLVED